MPSVCLTHHEHRETERLGTEHSWKCQPHLDLPSGSYQSLRNVPYNQLLPCNCINNCRHLHNRVPLNPVGMQWLWPPMPVSGVLRNSTERVTEGTVHVSLNRQTGQDWDGATDHRRNTSRQRTTPEGFVEEHTANHWNNLKILDQPELKTKAR